MSRHVLVDRPDCLVVLGFDQPVRFFYGSRFDPSSGLPDAMAVASWPVPGSVCDRAARTHLEAEDHVRELLEWAARQQRQDVWSDREASLYLAFVGRTLREEFADGVGYLPLKPPAILKGPRP